MEVIAEKLKQRKSDNTWDIIAAIDWGTDLADIDNLSEALMEVIPQEIWGSFVEDVNGLIDYVDEIAVAVPTRDVQEMEYTDYNLFDTKFEFWREIESYIVGLGKESYDEFIDDPIAYVERKIEENGTDWYINGFLGAINELSDDVY